MTKDFLDKYKNSTLADQKTLFCEAYPEVIVTLDLLIASAKKWWIKWLLERVKAFVEQRHEQDCPKVLS